MYTHHYRITWARVWPRCVTSREEARCHHFPFLLMGHTHTHIHESIWYNILPNSFRLLLLRYDKSRITSLIYILYMPDKKYSVCGNIFEVVYFLWVIGRWFRRDALWMSENWKFYDTNSRSSTQTISESHI